MTLCVYTADYLKEGKSKEYKCPNDAQYRNEYCIFHDKTFLNSIESVRIIEKEFLEQIKSAQSKSELICIGYILFDIPLEQSQCKIPMYFGRSIFKGKVDLSNLIFSKNISFAHAEFKKGVTFRNTSFKGEVDFSHCISKITSDFQFCVFDKNPNFIVVEFVNANFKNTLFKDNSNFAQAVLSGSSISFWKSIFNKSVMFASTKFLADTSFKECIFEKNANFSDAIFDKPILFENAQFIEQNLVIFDGNIRNVSFLNIEISNVKFGNNISWAGLPSTQKLDDAIKWRFVKRWGKLGVRFSNLALRHVLFMPILDQFENLEKKWDVLRRNFLLCIAHENIDFKIYDEYELEKNKQILQSLESIRNIYRQLIENFDQQMRYDLSGQFFVRDMELQRKYKIIHKENKIFTIEKNKLEKHVSILWLYNILAQYGQSYKRPIYLMIPIIGLATLYFLLSDYFDVIWNSFSWDNLSDVIWNTLSDVTWNSFSWDNVSNAFIRTMSGFFPFYHLNLNGNSENVTHIDWALRVLLLPITGTFFVALKRKLERKFKH